MAVGRQLPIVRFPAGLLQTNCSPINGFLQGRLTTDS
jgi:hypothetical protein